MDQGMTILEILRQRSPASRAELAAASGLSAATVSRAVDRLRREGLVREFTVAGESLGRPPRLVELLPEAAYVVGIDAGGSMLRAVLADLEGVVRARAARPLSDPRDRQALVADLVAVAREVMGVAAGRPVLAAVAGISGIVDHADGRVLLSPDLPALDGTALARVLEDALGLPVAIDNDDLLAAVGEAAAGAARGLADVAFLSLGYGLGAGLIVAGRPVRGASHAAGAIAFLGSGRIEERASGRAIPVRYLEAVGQASAESSGAVAPPGRTGLDARAVFELAAAGDPVARAVVGDAIDALGELVIDVAALFDPEVIVLGGGLVSSGSVLFEPLASRLRAEVPFPPRLVASALEGAAVVHGAVSVALAIGRQRLSGGAGTRRIQPDQSRVGPLRLA